MLNIPNILTIVGYRFGHPSGLDESSGWNSTAFLHGVEFRVYLLLSKIFKNMTHCQLLTETHLFEKGMPFVFVFKAPEASLKRRKWGMGTPIHMKMSWKDLIDNLQQYIYTYIMQCSLLVLNRAVILPWLLALLGLKGYCPFLGWIAMTYYHGYQDVAAERARVPCGAASFFGKVFCINKMPFV